MTSESPKPALCARCGLRPVAEEGESTLPRAMHLEDLCESCLSVEIQSRTDEAMKEMGRQAEVAFGPHGPPGGVTGEEFVRSAFEDMRRREESPEWQARARPIRQMMAYILTELKAELPGGLEDPAFEREMQKRMREWQERHPELDADAST